MKLPLVSIIIDTYNYGCFIEKAIESVLKQNFPKDEIEIIIVDDGSTDDTKERVKKYLNYVKYIYQENKGQAAAFNTGISVSKGEIICFLDSDDWWEDKKIKIVVESFNKNSKIGMIQHLMYDVDVNGNIINSKYEPRKEYYNFEDFLNGNVSFCGTSGLAFRREYLEKILPIPEELFYCADEYLYNVIFYSYVYSINLFLGYKRIHGKNWFAGTISDLNRLKNHVKVRKIILYDIEKRLKELNINIKNTNLYLPIELLKEEVIMYSKLQEKRKAIKALFNYFKRYKIKKYLIFTYCTLFLAIVSPILYIKLYEIYAKQKIFYKLKKIIFSR